MLIQSLGRIRTPALEEDEENEIRHEEYHEGAACELLFEPERVSFGKRRRRGSRMTASLRSISVILWIRVLSGFEAAHGAPPGADALGTEI